MSLEAMNIPQVSLEGYEADDVIGTLSKHADKEGFKTYMVTPDKDFGQLVTANTFIYKPGTRFGGPKVMGVDEVCEKFGLNNIEQFIDFLGIMGDKSDNIPGVFGVGEKTAQKLITEYGSIEQVYEGIDNIKGKLKEKLENSKENAFLSKDLVTINTDAPVKFSFDDFKIKEPNFQKIELLFKELEFNNILNRVKKVFNLSNDDDEHQVKSKIGLQTDLFSQLEDENIKESGSIKYFKDEINIESIEDLNRFKKQLSNYEKISIQGFKNNYEKLVLSMSLDGKSLFILNENNEEITIEIIQEFLQDVFIQNIEKVCFDIKKLWNITGLKFQSNINQNLFDIMLAAYIVNADERNENNTLIKRILKIDLDYDSKNYEDFKQFNFNLTVLNLKLYNQLLISLKESGTVELFSEIETPLMSVLFQMEQAGFNLDRETLANFSNKLKSEIDNIRLDIFKIAGKEFNISSPKQLGDVLFVDLNLDKNAKKTKTGQFSTSEQNLQSLKNNHPIIELVLNYRSLEKLFSTYVEALPSLVNVNTNKIHTTFNQAVAATGRLSSKEPNLQNIPIRTKYGQEIRKAFIPSKNNLLLAADYSQIELRLIAEFSSEPTMTKAFLDDKDIHSITASKLFNVPFESVTREMRSNAKTVNFGIIYGVSAFGLSQQTNLSRKESSELINTYFNQYKHLKTYMNEQVAFARNNGYVETILGRRRYLRDINSRNALLRSHAERNAINAPIQGSAADIIKKAMISIYNDFISLKLKSKMILQVHDELIFDVDISEKEIVAKIVKTKMESAYETKIPLKVEAGFGENWLQAH